MVAAPELVRPRVEHQGYCLLETSTRQFDALANRLGRAVPVRPHGPTTDRLRPTSTSDASPRSLSALHGLAEFPFHTDAAHHAVPPRYLLLRLEDGACTAVPTLVVDGRPTELAVKDATTLSREMWLVRPGGSRAFYAPILDRSRTLLRFDAGCMAAPTGTALAGEELLRQHLASARKKEIRWYQGLTLVLDNWRMLHARPNIPRMERGRILLRKLVA